MNGARRACLLAMLLATACSGGPSQPPRMVEQPIEPGQLVPGSMNIVARVDWDRAGKAEVRESLLAWLRTAQVSERVLDTVQGCLPGASELTIALRSSRAGFEGDVILLARLKAHDARASQTEAPCSASGWRFVKESRGMRLFDRELPRSDRPEPGLLVAGDDSVAVVSQAPLDAVLRILRGGPDPDRIDPIGSSMITLDARVSRDLVPDGLRGRSPVLADLARGLEHVRLQVDAAADSVRVRSVLTYAAAEDAKAAGAILTRLRSALAESDDLAWRTAARSAHAALSESVLRVTFEVPR